MVNILLYNISQGAAGNNSRILYFTAAEDKQFDEWCILSHKTYPSQQKLIQIIKIAHIFFESGHYLIIIETHE